MMQNFFRISFELSARSVSQFFFNVQEEMKKRERVAKRQTDVFHSEMQIMFGTIDFSDRWGVAMNSFEDFLIF